jgi:hypothetical protein
VKHNNANRNGENAGNGTTFTRACLTSCKKVLAQIAGAREAIFEESRRALGAPERLLRLALNEAEAAAWQTLYPHLVFPTLATEKIQAIAAWNARQQLVRRTSPHFARAA